MPNEDPARVAVFAAAAAAAAVMAVARVVSRVDALRTRSKKTIVSTYG